MATQSVILQSTYADQIVDDITSGATAWTTWSIGLVTAVLGFMLLVKMASTLMNRL